MIRQREITACVSCHRRILMQHGLYVVKLYRFLEDNSWIGCLITCSKMIKGGYLLFKENSFYLPSTKFCRLYDYKIHSKYFSEFPQNLDASVFFIKTIFIPLSHSKKIQLVIDIWKLLTYSNYYTQNVGGYNSI